MNKLLLLGSVVSPCPPKKQGGTERIAYFQAKHLAKRGIKIILVGAKGTKDNFFEQIHFEDPQNANSVISKIEFVEIGGGTAFGTQEDAIKLDLSKIEASRKLRLEMVNLARVSQLIIERKDEIKVILNNMRGEATFLPLANLLGKKFINVMHLNIFPELAELFQIYQTNIITISNAQRENFPKLNYVSTIYNPVNTNLFTFSEQPDNYALMVGTIGRHKNQKEAILACLKTDIPLVLAGKIRDQDYFNKEIAPLIDGKKIIHQGELEFEEKLKLYQKAKVFLFPIKWQEPFGLVVIEALACGTPVVAYPNGGPKEIVIDKKTGFLVNSWEEMAEKIKQIESINRLDCRKNVEERFSEEIIGEQYYKTILSL